MKPVIAVLFLLSIFPCILYAQNDVPIERKSFIVIYSGRSYAPALKKAKEAASKLQYPLDLRGLQPNKETGLTITEADADSNGWEYPTNYPRGRFDDGKYVSIEYSSGYDEWKPKQYLVIVWSGFPMDPKRKIVFSEVKKLFPSARVQNTNIYTGCMH